MWHLTTEDAVDFVNQLIPTNRKVAIEEHRKSCRRCAETISQLQRVRKCAAAEARYQPPQDAVRIARVEFAALESARRSKRARTSIEAVFDSFRNPGMEGVRSAGDGTRRLLYHADPFQIDLQIELQSSEKRLLVTGQLLGSRDPGAVGRNLTLILFDLRGGAVRTVTNQFGEFRAEIENSGELALVCYQGDEKPIVIYVPDVLGQSSGSEGKQGKKN